MNKCDFCGASDEIEAHLFFACDFSRAFWFGTSLHINMVGLGVNDFLEGWQRMEKEVDIEAMMQKVVFGFWRIWKCRNEIVFNGVQILPHVAVDLWQRQIVQFRDAMGDTMGEGGEDIRVRLSGVGRRLGQSRGEDLGSRGKDRGIGEGMGFEEGH